MKRGILSVIFAGLVSTVAFAGTTIEIQAPLVVQAPPPVYEPAPSYEPTPAPPPVYEPVPPPPPAVVPPPMAPIPPFAAPPLMVWDPKFGMYFALGAPNDLFFYGGYYFVYTNMGWYRSLGFNGPWIFTERTWLPPVFLRYSIDGIRHYREGLYRDYQARPFAFRDRTFDHHTDRFRSAYDRSFMNRNREQMQKDRAFSARYNKNPGNRAKAEHHDKAVQKKNEEKSGEERR